MARLSDLFVSIRADDKQASRAIAGVRASLTSLDRQKVQPRIEMPTKATADIKGLERQLVALGRQRVNLAVNSTTAKADVSTLTKQLETLQRRRHQVPVELQGKIDQQIAEVQRDLAAVSRKDTQIPLKLERVDAKVAAVRTALNKLETDAVDVKVDVDKDNSLRGRMARVKQTIASGLKGGPEIDRAGRDAGKTYGNGFGASVKGVLTGAVVVGAARALAGGLASTVTAAGGFEKSMAQVGVQTKQTGQGMKDLTALALDMGAKTSFSAQGASDAMLELAKGGLSAADIKAGVLQETLTLASAGGLELGKAATYMVQGLNTFGLSAGDAGRVSAALAGAANASTASVEDMGFALSQVGPGARVAGLSLEDTAAAIAAFTNNGMKGSDAGTSLKTMLARLVPSTDKAVSSFMNLGLLALDTDKSMQVLKDNGVKPLGSDAGTLTGQLQTLAAKLSGTKEGSAGAQKAYLDLATSTGAMSNQFFDAQGNIKSMSEVSGVLQKALAGQTREQKIATLNTLFGSDASRAAAVLAKEGAAGLAVYTKATNDSAAAQNLAQQATKGWSGAKEALSGGIETLQIQIGTHLLPVLTRMAKYITANVLPSLSRFVEQVGPKLGPALAEAGRVLGVVGAGVVAVGRFFSANREVIGLFAVTLGTVVAGLKLLAIQQALVAAGGLLAFLRAAVTSTRLFAAAQAALNVVMRANPIGIIITAVAALAAGVVYAYKNFEPFRKAVDAVGAALKAGLLAAIDGVTAAFKRVAAAATADWAAVKNAVTTAWNGIVSFFSGAGAAIVGAVSRVWAAVATDVGKAWTGIKSAVSTAWNTIVGFFTTGAGGRIIAAIGAVWTSVQRAVAGAFSAIGGAIKTAIGLWLTLIKIELAVIGAVFLTAWRGLSVVARTAFDAVRAVVATVWAAIRAVFTSAQSALAAAWSTFWSGVTSVARTVWNAVNTAVIQPVWVAIRGVFTSAQRVLSAAWTAFWGIVRATANTVWNAIKDNVITPVWTAIRTIFTTAQRVLSAAWSVFWGVVRTTANTIFTAIKDFINTNWNAIKTLWAAAHALLRAAWTTFWNAIRTTATTIFNAIRTLLNTVWNNIKSLWSAAQGAVQSSWTTFWTRVKSIGGAAIEWVRAQINSKLEAVKGIVSRFVSAVGGIWGGIQDKFSGPWNWVKRNVIDKLVGAYNTVARVVGAPTVNLADGGPVGQTGAGTTPAGTFVPPNRRDGGEIDNRAAGGRIRGRGGPRQDNIAGIDRATGVQTSWVSAGEYVVNAKAYRRNKQAVEAINAGLDVEAASMRRMNRQAVARAGGGSIPELWLGGGTKPAAGSVTKHSGYSWARWAGDINEPGAADNGKPVVAYKAGTVASNTTMSGSYGKHIRMNHAGSERTLYAHLSQFTARPGQKVSEGQKIGEKGNTGNSSGPHLHFELAGGSNKITDKLTGQLGNVIESVIQYIKPRQMFMTASNPIMSLIEKGLGALPGGKTPWGRLVGMVPRKMRDVMASKLPESFAIETPGGGSAGSSASSSSGDGPRAAAARKYINATWPQIRTIYGFVKKNIAGTNTPSKHSMGKALDLMTSNKALGNEIANYFAGSGRGRFGVDNVIWNRRIHNARGWHGYNGSNPHTDHVHVDFFKNGGLVPQLAGGGIVQGGRGGTVARIGEGVRDELVTPLPRGWKTDRRDSGSSDVAELVALLKAGRLGNEFHFTTYNPVVEAQSVTTNRALQRVGSLDLV